MTPQKVLEILPGKKTMLGVIVLADMNIETPQTVADRGLVNFRRFQIHLFAQIERRKIEHEIAAAFRIYVGNASSDCLRT